MKLKSKSKPKILGIIPARGGSKGIPHKNIANLRGRPLIGWAVKACKTSKMLDWCYVSTDDENIIRIAATYGIGSVKRPANISGDKSRDIEFLQHTLDNFARILKPDIIAWFPPTCATRTSQDIDDVLEYMVKNNLDSIRTTVYLDIHPLKTCLIYKDKMTPLIELTPFKALGVGVPRQLLPPAMLPFGLVYATKTKFIKNGQLWGDKLEYYPVALNKYLDIDTPEQLERAQAKVREFGIK